MNLEQLIYVEAKVEVSQRGIKNLEVDVVYMFENQARRFRNRVLDTIQQADYIWAPTQILQDFYFL